MTYQEMTKKYEERGLTNYKLRTLDDLKEIHGVYVQELSGYSGLSDDNRKLFDVTVLRFYNAHGLNSRLELRPKAVNYVLEKDYTKVIGDDRYGVATQGFVIDRNGQVTDNCLYNSIESEAEIADCEESLLRYICFELNNDWFHITEKGEWY